MSFMPACYYDHILNSIIRQLLAVIVIMTQVKKKLYAFGCDIVYRAKKPTLGGGWGGRRDQ